MTYAALFMLTSVIVGGTSALVGFVAGTAAGRRQERAEIARLVQWQAEQVARQRELVARVRTDRAYDVN